MIHNNNKISLKRRRITLSNVNDNSRYIINSYENEITKYDSRLKTIHLSEDMDSLDEIFKEFDRFFSDDE